MPLQDASNGPFKSFALLAFPMSWPAVVYGTVASLLFYGGQALLALVFDDVDSAAAATALFGQNFRSCLLGLRLTPLGGSAWLFALQSLWLLALWGVFGTAICRILALRLCREEYLGYRDALAFGFRIAPGAWLYPVILVGSAAIPLLLNAALGALAQIPYVGIVFYLAIPLAWLGTILAVALMLSGIFGIGLVPGALAVERKGTLDAWGKSLNYLFARPLHVILYIVLLKVFLVDILWHYAFEVRVLSRWTESSLKIFFTTDSFDRITSRVAAEDLTTYETIAFWTYRSITAGFDALTIGFAVSCFFAAFVGMFLVFRRDVDGIDVSDMDIEESDPEVDPNPVSPAAQ